MGLESAIGSGHPAIEANDVLNRRRFIQFAADERVLLVGITYQSRT